MMIISADRIRSIVADCKTLPDLTHSLRSHKIKYSLTTDTGYLSVRIPCRKGCIRIYKTCSRSAPFLVRSESPAVNVYPYPLPRFAWDD